MVAHGNIDMQYPYVMAYVCFRLLVISRRFVGNVDIGLALNDLVNGWLAYAQLSSNRSSGLSLFRQSANQANGIVTDADAGTAGRSAALAVFC